MTKVRWLGGTVTANLPDGTRLLQYGDLFELPDDEAEGRIDVEIVRERAKKAPIEVEVGGSVAPVGATE